MRVAATIAACLLVARGALASEVGCPAHVETPDALATYYVPGSGEGACSLPMPGGTFYAAIASADFAGSEMCGRCVRITGPEGAITAQIADECPAISGCAAGHLDLAGEAAFDAIANPFDGIVAIAWETVACDVGETAMRLQFESSNPFYVKVEVQNHRHGVAAVAMRDGAQWVDLPRTIDNHFERVAGGPFDQPYYFRITSVHGETVETIGITPANDVPIDAGVQFVPCPEPAAVGASIALAALAAIARRRVQGAAACTTASSSAP